jgi:hypothetical protein
LYGRLLSCHVARNKTGLLFIVRVWPSVAYLVTL